MSKLNLKNILIFILASLLVISFFFGDKSTNQNKDNKIKLLRENNIVLVGKIDSLSKINFILDKNIELIDNKISVNDKKIISLNEIIINLNNGKNEIDNSVHRLSSDIVAIKLSNFTEKEYSVTTVINLKGDTIITMPLSGAKSVLTVLMTKEVLDSSVIVLTDWAEIAKETDKLKTLKLENKENKIVNLNTNNNSLLVIINNKDSEILLLNEQIKTQKKQIKKQKIFKMVGFVSVSAVLITITILNLIK